MDILKFVQTYCAGFKLSSRTNSQFGVLAFDLGDVSAAHPPKEQNYTTLNDEVVEGQPSGPWSVQVRSWKPVVELVVENGKYKVDKNGELIAKSYGEKEIICSERWLLAGLPRYLEAYHTAYKRFPSSVSLYSTMTPCTKCNSYMKPMPAATHTESAGKHSATIEKWYLAYTKNYDAEYKTASQGDAATNELVKSCWVVTKG